MEKKSNYKKPTKHIPAETMKLEVLRSKDIKSLIEIADGLKIENPNEYKRNDLIFEILKYQVSSSEFLLFTGILEVMSDGYGFLRSLDITDEENSINDAYVSNSQIKKFVLRNGDIVTGQVRKPKDQEKYYALIKIEAINFKPVSESKNRPLFDNLTPIFPEEILQLEYQPDKLTGRMIDLFSPIGKGQRCLIVSPPKSGKTEILKEIAHGITLNNPEAELIVLLIDERPEEVTDMQRSTKAEVYHSTFDKPAKNHVKVANMVIEKAKRSVEMGNDVVILLDSITRLARAYNTVTPSSGKVLSGGVDANALHKPKKFFGSARNVEFGGSLTIIATALIETGSKMDEVIFEEFKGTGNSDLVLSRSLSEKRIYPAVDILKSGTRKEEILISKDDLPKIWVLRNALNSSEFAKNDVEAMRFLFSKLNKTRNNQEFLSIMNDGGIQK